MKRLACILEPFHPRPFRDRLILADLLGCFRSGFGEKTDDSIGIDLFRVWHDGGAIPCDIEIWPAGLLYDRRAEGAAGFQRNTLRKSVKLRDAGGYHFQAAVASCGGDNGDAYGSARRKIDRLHPFTDQMHRRVAVAADRQPIAVEPQRHIGSRRYEGKREEQAEHAELKRIHLRWVKSPLRRADRSNRKPGTCRPSFCGASAGRRALVDERLPA